MKAIPLLIAELAASAGLARGARLAAVILPARGMKAQEAILKKRKGRSPGD